MAVNHVDPTDWILDRWDLQTLPRYSPVHDLARKSRHSCAIEYVTFPGNLRFPFTQWYFPPALFCICVRRLHHLQSVHFVSTNFLDLFILIGHFRRLLPIVFLYCSIKLFLGLLDSSQQCQDQSAIRRHPRHGHGYPHLRLGSNRRLQRLSSCHALVGCSQHWVHNRDFLLDHHRLSLCK
jgi:hypothetical protein